MDQNNPIFTPHSDDQADNQSDDQTKKQADDQNKTDDDKKAVIEPKPAEPNEIEPEKPIQHVKPFGATNKLTDEKAEEIEEPTTQVKINNPITESSVPETPVSVIEKHPQEEAIKSPPPVHTFPNHDQDLAATMFPPKKTPSTAKAVVIVAVVAIAFMAVGFGGGFFGFKYSPKLASLFKTSADSSSTTSTDSTKPQSTKATPGDISVWPIYNNATYLYSVKYPDNWYSQNTNDTTSKTVTFSNSVLQAEQSKTNTEEKVEVSVQSANGQDLKTWVESQGTVAQNTASLATLTVSGQEAYQQETTGENKTVKTYIKQGENIITLIYSADSGVYTTGKTIYDSIIGTLKLS